MASDGPRYPGTSASLSNAGTSENAEAWVTPGNAGADDGTQTTITAATYDSPDISQLLVCSNFGFNLPVGSRVTGITVDMDRSNAAGAASDNRMQLATGTTFADLVGDNKADTATDWPTTLATVSYGSSSDTWNANLTAAQVNAAGFAVMMSVQADAANTDVGVDFIRVTIEYVPPGQVTRRRRGEQSSLWNSNRIEPRPLYRRRTVSAYVNTIQPSGGPIIRAWAEALTSSDVLTRLGTFLRSMTNAPTSSDSWTRSGGFLRAWTTTLTTSDVWTTIKIFVRSWSETLTTSDAWSRLGTFLRTWTSAPASSDSWTRSGGFLRAWSEAPSTSDVWVSLKVFLRSWAEAATTSDIWTRTGTFLRTWSTTLTSSDVWDRLGTFLRSWSEALSTADAWLADISGAIIRAWSETLTTSDVWTRLGTFLRPWSSALTTSDVWAAVRLIVRSWSTTLTTADTWTRSVTILRGWVESAITSDAWSRAVTIVRTWSTTVSTSDVWAAVKNPVLQLIGGIAPTISRIYNAIVGSLPSGSARSSTPGGRATHHRPEDD